MSEEAVTARSCGLSGSAPAAAESAAFVLCIENNETRGQALLLIESLRAFGGRFAGSEVLAVAPRPGLGVDAPTRARLDALGATYHEAPLNTACPEYASANRLYAAAWAVRNCRADTLFVLDSDTLFLDEPEPLGPGWDLAARPVDVKGPTSEGPGDPFEPYWAAMCGLAGMAIAALPFVETIFDRRRVRASYNGGYSVVRRTSGLLERTAELFTRSVETGLRPYRGMASHHVFASTGFVTPQASQYWGSNQAALAIAARVLALRVRELDRRFNLPLHMLALEEHWSADWANLSPVHIHYHWLLRASHREQAFATLAKLGVAGERLEWIRERATLIERWPVPVPSRPPARSSGPGRPLVISARPRAGPPLLGSVLRAAGLAGGWDLMGPAPGNWRGHFEDSDFYRLHEAMLSAAGATSLSADDGFAAPADDAFEARARALVESRSAFPLWGWKDPRTCLLLEFWDALLPAASYLFLYRHPIEVALSLRRRATDSEIFADPWIGIRSWEVHNRRLLAFRDRHPERCFLAQVPAVTADFAELVRQVAAKFALPLVPPETASPFAPEELTDNLAVTGLFPAWEGLLPEALALYDQLEARADLPARRPGEDAPARPAAALGDLDATPARQATEALFLDLLRTHLTRESPAGPAARRDGPLRWTPVERERFEALRAGLERGEARIAELERELRTASARRDELAATLSSIERSRGFGLVTAAWRLSDRWRSPGDKSR